MRDYIANRNRKTAFDTFKKACAFGRVQRLQNHEQNHFCHEKRSSVRLTYSASNDIDIMMLIFIIKCPISINSKIEGKPKTLKLGQAIRLIGKLNRRRPRACKLRAIPLYYSYCDLSDVIIFI